jgi:hypothetical protein
MTLASSTANAPTRPVQASDQTATSRPCASSPGHPMNGTSPLEEMMACSWCGEPMG